MKTVFAAFVVANVDDHFAATTRAADRGELGKIGFPGGKLDAGETAREAAMREASEEGWLVTGLSDEPYHEAIIDGNLVQWFHAVGATILATFKEQGRILPIVAHRIDLINSGWGNDAALEGACYRGISDEEFFA